ncbi:MAG TPA: DUF1015 family protein [Blastocatellia bacterium]|nr:DUF1015 family protein [Blastocatellia bacterium]
MATVRAFKAIRPVPQRAAKTSAVPYDVVTVPEARELAAGNPFSFLHVSRAEIDLSDGTDPYSAAVYDKAAANFEDLKRNCPMIEEESPSLYAYRLEASGHSQVGIAACCSIDEYDQDVIRKHERTRRDKEDDRTRHMLALRAQTGPVFLTYRSSPEIDDAIAKTLSSQALFDFTAPDGVRHTLWRLGEVVASQVAELFGIVPALYIADGHHRAASASRARAQLRSSNQGHTGDEEYNYFLAVLFPSDQVRILPYNRVVRDLNGKTPDAFLKELSEHFRVSPDGAPAPAAKGNVSVYLAGRWYGLRIPPASVNLSDPISALDVSVLQDRVLDRILGIKDVRTDKRIDFIGGIKGAAQLERVVDTGAAAVAFSFFPVTVTELMSISDANQIMPPKSTWFEPKLRDGLLSHVI